MKPIRVNVRLKNNILTTLREQAGMSPRRLAEELGLSYQHYLDLEGMRRTVLTVRGDWSEPARRIAAYWGRVPEELFPEVVRRVKRTSGSFVMDERQLQRLLAAPRESLPALPEEIPDRLVVSREVRERVDEMFNLMRTHVWDHNTCRIPTEADLFRLERRIEMFKLHHGWDDGVEFTFEEIAQRFNLSRGRVAQIIEKFYPMLRHSSRGLREIYSEEDA